MTRVKHPLNVQDENPWRQPAELLGVMAHPARLAILEALCERPRCVKRINFQIPISQPQLSQHMASLRKVNLVACHACGPLRCYYVLQPDLVKKLLQLLRQDPAIVERDGDSIVQEARREWEDQENG